MQDTKCSLPDEWRNAVNENMQSGLSELWILSLLAERDMYTYEIREELFRRSGGTIQLKDGSMYAPMYRMRERGLISGQKITVGKRRIRMYYHLEDAGKEYLSYAAERFREIFCLTDSLIGAGKSD
jgi:PadR family transcriptional regulator, regulatory protein PadR